MADVPPNAVLHYYTLDNLGLPGERDKRFFGPFLKLHYYNHETQQYLISVLIVKHFSQFPDAKPHITWEHPVHGQGQEWGEGLHTERNGFQFWRLCIKTTLLETAHDITYRIDQLGERSWRVRVPSAQEQWHWMMYSCNGMHQPEEYEATGGIQPLWHDVLKVHAERPFHFMVGGGDQLYNDAAFNGPLLKGWDMPRDGAEMRTRLDDPFTPEIQAEVEDFYFSHYCFHFQQPAYCDALATIPSLNVWDDHDIFDGWGSYPAELQSAPIMHGVYATARTFYLLFQLHTTDVLRAADGYWPAAGPEANRIMQLGPGAAIAMLDHRSSRSMQRIMSEEAVAEMEARLRELPASVRHLMVVLAVPILYPKLPVQTTLKELSLVSCGQSGLSLVMQKTGLADALTERFGLVEILDDITDHWDACEHEQERQEMLEKLMHFAKERRVRVHILSGDVHCAGYGIFYTHKNQKQGIWGSLREVVDGNDDDPEDLPPPPEVLARDHRFVAQLITSAIGNVPPPGPVLRALETAAMKADQIGEHIMGRMMPAFGPKGNSRSFLHGHRNWAEVTVAPDASNVRYELRCERHLKDPDVQIFPIDVPELLD